MSSLSNNDDRGDDRDDYDDDDEIDDENPVGTTYYITSCKKNHRFIHLSQLFSPEAGAAFHPPHQMAYCL